MSNRQVNGDTQVVVSLTTYGKRLQVVYLTIESIVSGCARPKRLILWVQDEHQFLNLPKSLQRLRERGLEIRLSKNYGSHTKYYPYIKEFAADNLPLVTADDDVFYPQFWLEGLYQAYLKDDKVVSCYRAHLMLIDEESNKVAPFYKWGMCNTDVPSYMHHATGVAGIIYPPKLLHMLANAGDVFLELCPKGDDIWLHVNSIRNGYKIRQIFKNDLKLRTIPFTQQDGLIQQNAHEGLNTIQADKTYTPNDIAILKTELTKSA
ncbi:MAG TPA: hypothetical protein PLR90_01415 [Methylophilus sp.]|nr:hypothetical protein [Methylophilus sp.]HQQ32550.1 hypothetical protein [Methylophilus sp.]